MPEHHIVLTAVYTGGYATINALVTPRPGSTRQSLFNELLDKLSRDCGVGPRALTPVFFSLEPNQLTATR